ncbi:MAG: MBL fold metallo-hydrolase [Saprospiraceae bacterium]
MTTRRTFLKQSSLLAGTAMLPMQNLMAQILGIDAGEMKTLRNNVGIYTERGGTIGWMIDKEGIIVIDTQFPEQATNFIGQVKEKTDRKIDLLINTHHHGDHSGGNIAFKGLVTQVVAHTNSKIHQERVAKERGNEDQQLYPDTTYDTEWTKKIGGEIVKMHYFGAGHTGGDSLIHLENANIVHMGDLLFNRLIPNIDAGAGASIISWIKLLKKAQKTFDKDTLFICGHAGEGYEVTGNLATLKAKEIYLKTLMKYVKKEKKKGTTLEQLKAKPGLIPGAPDWTGDRFKNVNLEVAWNELGA